MATIGNSGMFDTLKGNLLEAGAKTIQDVYNMAEMLRPNPRSGWRDISMDVYYAILPPPSPNYNPNSSGEEGEVEDFSLGAAAMQPQQDMMQQGMMQQAMGVDHQQQQQDTPQPLTPDAFNKLSPKQRKFDAYQDLANMGDGGSAISQNATHVQLNNAYNELYQRWHDSQSSGRDSGATKRGDDRGRARQRTGPAPSSFGQSSSSSFGQSSSSSSSSVGSKVETMEQEHKADDAPQPPMSTALVQGVRPRASALESINNAMLASVTSTQSAARTMRAQLLQRVQQGAIGGDVLNASDEAFNRVQTELNTFLTRIFIGDAAAVVSGDGNRPILREQVQGEAGVDGTMITRPGMMVLFSPEVQNVVSQDGLDLGPVGDSLQSNFPIQSGAQQLASGNSSGQQRVLNIIPQEQWAQMTAEITQGISDPANQERALGQYFRQGQGINAAGQEVTFYYILVPRGNTLFNMSPEQYSEYADMVRSRGSWVGEQRDNRQTISRIYRELLDIEAMQMTGRGLSEVRRMREEGNNIAIPIIRRTALYAQACVDVLVNPTYLVQQQQQQMRLPLDIIALQEIRLTENIIRATTMLREIINLPAIGEPSNKRQAILHWMLGYFGQNTQQRRMRAREAARNYLWLQIELWYNWYINVTSRFARDGNGNMGRDASREEGGAQYRSLATYNFTNGGVRIQEGDDGSTVDLLEYRLLEVPAYIRESLALVYIDERAVSAEQEVAAFRTARARVISRYEGLPAEMENVRHTTDLFSYVSSNQDRIRAAALSGPEGALQIYELLRNSVDLRSGITIEQLQQQVQASQAVQANIARELQAQQQQVAEGSAAASKQQESCRTGQSSGAECITDSMYTRGMVIHLYLPRARAQANRLRPLQRAIIEIVGNGRDSPARPGLNANGQQLPPMTQSLSSTINHETPIAIGSYLINTGGHGLRGPDNRRIITVIEINNILAINESGQIIQINYRNGIRHLMERSPMVGIDGQRLVQEEEDRRVNSGNDIIDDRRGETAAARRRAYFAHTLAENNQQGALLAQVVQEMLTRQRQRLQRVAQVQSEQQAQAIANQKQGEALMAQQGAQPANMALADDLFNSYFLYQRMHTQLNSLWYAGRQMDITGEYRTVGGVRQTPEEWFDRESYLNQGRTTLGGSALPQPRQTIVDVFVGGLRSLFQRGDATNLPTLGDLWNGGVPLSFVEFITRYQVGGGNPEQVMRTAFGPDILPTGEGLHDLAQAQRLDGEYRGWIRRRAQQVTPSQGASSSSAPTASNKDGDMDSDGDGDMLGGGGRRKKKTRSKKSKHSKMGGRKKKTRKKRGGNESSGVPAMPAAITEYCDKYNKPEAECDKSHKKTYHKLAREHHPDKGGNEAHFKKLGECHSVAKANCEPKDEPENKESAEQPEPTGPVAADAVSTNMPELEDVEEPKEEPTAAPALEDTATLEDTPEEPKNKETQKFIKEKLKKLKILSAETLKQIEVEKEKFVELTKEEQLKELKRLIETPAAATETPETEQEGGRKKRRRKTKKRKSKKRKSKKRKTRRRKSKRRR